MMETSISGFLYVAFIIYIFLKKGNSFRRVVLLCLLTELFLQRGLLFSYGNYFFEIQNFVEDVLIIYCISHIGVIKYDSSIIKRRWRWLVISYILPILLLIIFPSYMLVANMDVSWDKILFEGMSPVYPRISDTVIKATIKVLLFMIVTFYIYNIWKEKDYKWLIYKTSRLSNIFLFFGFIEYLFRNILRMNDLWSKGLLLLFGQTNSIILEGKERGDALGLCLFDKEPSGLAHALFFVLIFKFANDVLKGKKVYKDFSIYLCLLLMIITTSFTTFLFISGFICIYLLYRWNVERPKYAKIEIVSFLLILFLSSSSVMLYLGTVDSYITGRLVNILDNLEYFLDVDWSANVFLGDSSSQVRLLSILQTLLAFIKRPLFGYSLFTVVCHGATPQYLAGVGIFGFYCWIRFYFFSIPLFDKNRINIGSYYLCILIYTIVHLFCGWLIRPYYDLMLLIYIASCSFIFSSKLNRC